MQKITFQPIGLIHTDYQTVQGVPIQSAVASESKGRVEVYSQFQDGLKDLDGFSHIILLYCFHRSKPFSLRVKPFLDDVERGVFATRAPSRPNHIGMSVVGLIRIEANNLWIDHVDILDKTPLLDIKPYVPKFDLWDVQRSGWLADKADNAENTSDDGRFASKGQQKKRGQVFD